MKKIINNNVVITVADNGQETVAMGKGIGFQAKAGQQVDEKKNETTVGAVGQYMTGIVCTIFALLPVRAGFAFSGGFIDWVICAKLPVALNTWMIIPIGLVVAVIILEGVGGKENVTSIDSCVTRLRLEVKDYTAVDEKKIKSAGVAGVIRPGKTSVQVVVGTKVQFVADEFKKLCK